MPDLDAAAFLLDRKRSRRKPNCTPWWPSTCRNVWPRRWRGTVSGWRTAGPHIAISAQQLQAWTISPTGTEGYTKAEVTAGGIDTRDLSSKTMRSVNVPGLFSSVRRSTSPAGLAATTSNGPGPADGAQERQPDSRHRRKQQEHPANHQMHRTCRIVVRPVASVTVLMNNVRTSSVIASGARPSVNGSTQTKATPLRRSEWSVRYWPARSPGRGSNWSAELVRPRCQDRCGTLG